MEITHDMLERAARQVVEITAGLAVRGATRHTRGDDASAELVGTLCFLGTFGGTLVVQCTWQRATAIAAAMLASSEAPADDTIRDAMGEVVNQIGGVIKRAVAAGANEMLLSPPVVVSGSPLTHRVRSSATPICVDLDLDGGPLGIRLWPETRTFR